MTYRRKQSNPHEFIIKCTVITSFMAFDNHADIILFHFGIEFSQKSWNEVRNN